MVPEVEKPWVTEIRVRMDCNGCVQKIKKALHGITGIYDLYIDVPQQKITIIGWADPVKMVKAIQKTRKRAVICSHTEQSDQQTEGEATEGGAPPSESANPPTEPPQTEAALPEAPQEPPSQPDNLPPEEKPYISSSDEKETSHSSQPSKPKEPEEIHVVYHHPPHYGYRYAYGHYHQQGNEGQWNAYPTGPGWDPHPPRPVSVTHSYNTYRPSPYVTEYAYPHSPPEYLHYNRPDPYSQVYYSGNSSNGNGNIASVFSEENPNSCNIV